jgi:hypothetical protein
MQMSADIQKIQQAAVAHVPGERITAYQLCKDILKLSETDPLPSTLWSMSTKLPGAPPSRRTVKPVDAAEIAGRLGYTKGSRVLVFAEGQKREGVVEHISTTLCPGGVQVRYKSDDGDKMVLIPPWQFAELLRPALQEPLSVERSIITMDGQDDKRRPERKGTDKQKMQRAKSSEKRKFAPEARESKCQPAGCCVQ